MRLERGSTTYFVSLARLDGEVELTWGGGADEEYGAKTFATVADAREVYARKVAEKLTDGYRDVSSIRHPALEAALRSRRDDAATRAVYADWLEEQGSPLAAFMRPDQRPDRIEEALNARFGWPERSVVRLEWREGLWRGLQLRDDDFAVADRALLARELFGATACGTLEELAIEQTFASSTAAVIEEAARHAWAHDLPRFYLDTSSEYPEEVEPLGAIGAAVSAAFPRLRSLEIHTSQEWKGPDHVGPEGLRLPELEELWVMSATEGNLVALSRAALPVLRKLSLSVRSADDGVTALVDAIRALHPSIELSVR